MIVENKIKKMIIANKGYITRKNIDEARISSIYLSRYVKKYSLKQIVRGFYAVNDWIIDQYLVFQYTYPRFIYSFNTAIYLHSLGDILPNYLEVTGPLNYRPMAKKQDGVITHTDINYGSYNLGIIEVQTNLGNSVKVYDKEKTICDIIKHKDKMDFEVYVKALVRYAKSSDKNINKLIECARIMKIEDKVRTQMEVILNAD